MMLQHSNFDLDIAENGLQAVEIWEKGNYDLVLMDVQMPGQDGFAATGAIREKERATWRPYAHRRHDGPRLSGGRKALPRGRHGCLYPQTYRFETMHCN